MRSTECSSYYKLHFYMIINSINNSVSTVPPFVQTEQPHGLFCVDKPTENLNLSSASGRVVSTASPRLALCGGLTPALVYATTGGHHLPMPTELGRPGDFGRKEPCAHRTYTSNRQLPFSIILIRFNLSKPLKFFFP